MSKQFHKGIGDNYDINGNVIFGNLPQIPTSLAEIVNELANILSNHEDYETDGYKEFKPREKLLHNNVVEYEGIIDSYKVYYGKLNKLYRTFEVEGSDKKRIILKNLNTLYLKERDRLRKEKDISKEQVRKNHSDLILENIVDKLTHDIRSSKNLEVTLEQAREGIYSIVVDGFIKCKILENPSSK